MIYKSFQGLLRDSRNFQECLQVIEASQSFKKLPIASQKFHDLQVLYHHVKQRRASSCLPQRGGGRQADPMGGTRQQTGCTVSSTIFFCHQCTLTTGTSPGPGSAVAIATVITTASLTYNGFLPFEWGT